MGKRKRRSGFSGRHDSLLGFLQNVSEHDDGRLKFASTAVVAVQRETGRTTEVLYLLDPTNSNVAVSDREDKRNDGGSACMDDYLALLKEVFVD